MKRYFRRAAEDVGFGPGIALFEFDGEVAARQVEIYRGRRFYSDSAADYWPELGPGLIDQPLSSLRFRAEDEITASEFERVWAERPSRPV